MGSFVTNCVLAGAVHAHLGRRWATESDQGVFGRHVRTGGGRLNQTKESLVVMSLQAVGD